MPTSIKTFLANLDGEAWLRFFLAVAGLVLGLGLVAMLAVIAALA